MEPISLLATLGPTVSYLSPVFHSLVMMRNTTQSTGLQLELEEKRRQTQIELEGLRSQNQLGLQQGRFEQEKELQQRLATYNRETQQELAAYQRETTLKSAEAHKLFENWPLTIFPSQILGFRRTDKRIPLRIFLSPPKVQFERYSSAATQGLPEIEPRLAEGLAQFLSRNYPLGSLERPTEFLGGAWDSKRFRREASIKALFGMLQSEPTLILESEFDGDYLNFRLGYWGLGQEAYFYQTVSRLPHREIVFGSAKARALKWKTTRDKLRQMGKRPEEVDKLGGDSALNLKILEEEEDLRSAGINTNELSIHYSYKLNSNDFDELCQVLVTCHCLAAGWVADAYHLIHYDAPPLLPQLLPSLTKDAPDLQVLQALVHGYQEIYKALEVERPNWRPELELQLAQGLTQLPSKTWAWEQVDHSLKAWLQLRGVSQPRGVTPLEAMKAVLRVEDQEYVEQLKDCLVALGDRKAVAQAEELLREISDLSHRQQELERQQREEEKARLEAEERRREELKARIKAEQLRREEETELQRRLKAEAKSKGNLKDISIEDIIRLDHNYLNLLFTKLGQSNDPQKIQEYFGQIYKELSAHTQAEEQVVYPAVLSFYGNNNTQKLFDEQSEMKQLLDEIKSTSPASSKLKSKVKQLMYLIGDHIRQEESTMFAAIRSNCSTQQQAQMATQFMRAKSILQQKDSSAS